MYRVPEFPDSRLSCVLVVKSDPVGVSAPMPQFTVCKQIPLCIFHTKYLSEWAKIFDNFPFLAMVVRLSGQLSGM